MCRSMICDTFNIFFFFDIIFFALDILSRGISADSRKYTYYCSYGKLSDLYLSHLIPSVNICL